MGWQVDKKMLREHADELEQRIDEMKELHRATKKSVIDSVLHESNHRARGCPVVLNCKDN